ncbi:hypothetical protein GCM10027290_34930 [Micromonospora sonneratiae]|uniref:Recombinase zinc beta ribbon domain-containing protein n=1 Tax=Micromonospora sonneratiae TaxID=1184706 RepID=A0ABW3YAY6_9ACTN
MRQYGGSSGQAELQNVKIQTNSWWDNPGQPTPYLLWGLIWCRCGTTMVPLDRRNGTAATERFYRCDAGCGRPPVPAGSIEGEVLRAVVHETQEKRARRTPPWLRSLRSAWVHSCPDRRRDLIRRRIHRVVAGNGQAPQLYWLTYTSPAG